MRRLTTLPIAALLLLFLLSLSTKVQAATPTLFCKCTCFKKSMITPLNPPSTINSKSSRNKARAFTFTSLLSRSQSSLARTAAAAADDEKDDEQKPPEKTPFKQKTCADCNRSFCLDLNLPDCKDATEEDIVTSCFQRDSSKDEAVVFIFIITTVSLLGWALLKPVVGRWMEAAKERRSYFPVSSSQNR